MLGYAAMSIYRIFAFLFTSVTTGLAAAFIFVLLKPDLLEQRPPADPIPLTPATPGPASYADAVAAAAPSVVNIFATKLTQGKPTPLFKDPLLQRYFGNAFRKPKVKRENSLGSGVIVDSNGYILTNNHVIEGASEIRIALGGGQPVSARVMGVDPETDLAVLQAAGSDLPAATLSKSDSLRVGDVVLAIGNPYAVGQTVTMGIVSATGRNRLGITNYESFIQTDAAINPGNSGGALINARGEVVGINTAIFSKSGGSQGIGFAVPMTLAHDVMTQIINKGRVVRGWLGITGQDLTKSLAETLGLDETKGVLISGILKDGPADRAGIQLGDVILAIDGERVENSPKILSLVATKEPGSQIEIELFRAEKNITLTSDVDERPSDPDLLIEK